MRRRDEMGRATLQTVADAVGVSRMTVSNAFSRPDQLSAALRDKILAAADELGYAGPHPSARALARGAAGMVGLQFTEAPGDAFRDDVSVGFFAALATGFAGTGLSLILINPSGSDGVVPMRDTAMDGAILYACTRRDRSIDWLQRRGLPTVTVDQDVHPGVSSVNVADRSGAQAAAEHLVALGHRRVGIVNVRGLGPDSDREMDNLVARERRRGFLTGLGPHADDAVFVRSDFAGASDDDRAAIAELLSSRRRPTAMLCYSDVLAADVLGVAARLGLRVPQDLSVVGFDDNPLALRLHPRLTTVRQSLPDKGRAAATALIATMTAARRGSPARAKRVVIPTELIVRESTARAPR